MNDAAQDRELLQRAIGGDEQAFADIAVRYRAHMYSIAYRFLGNHEDAMDVCQDVLMTLLLKGHQYNGDASLAGWIRTIVVNRCRNFVRGESRKRLEFGHDDEVLAAQVSEDNIESNAIDIENARQVQDCIAELPDKQRTTMLLKIYQDLTLREVAEIMGCSLGTAKTNFFHAMRKLKICLGAKL